MSGVTSSISAETLNYLKYFSGIVGLLLICFVAFLAWRDAQILKANGNKSEGFPFSAMFTLIVLAGLVFVGLLAWIFQPSQDNPSNGFGTLAGLILLGMVVFIGIMNILTMSAARIGMLDGRQPFGLPEGSVRAILTIAFIVLVGVLSSFLLTGSNDRTGYSTNGVELEVLENKQAADVRVAELRRLYATDALVSIGTVMLEPTAAELAANEAAKPTTAYKIVVYPKVDNSVADDISKQTLTMVSTILAAMIGFYFASRSDAGAADPANVVRSEALKSLRELNEATKPEAALIALTKELDQYAKLAPDKLAANPAALKAGEADIKQWRSDLEALEKKLTAALAISKKDTASYTEITAARHDIESVNAALPPLQKAIADKQAALPA